MDVRSVKAAVELVECIRSQAPALNDEPEEPNSEEDYCMHCNTQVTVAAYHHKVCRQFINCVLN